jgi:hypothetical protein
VVSGSCFFQLSGNVERCVGGLYDVIYESFEIHVSKFVVDNSAVRRYLCFDMELHSLDINRTNAFKFVKSFEKMNLRPISESIH